MEKLKIEEERIIEHYKVRLIRIDKMDDPLGRELYGSFVYDLDNEHDEWFVTGACPLSHAEALFESLEIEPTNMSKLQDAIRAKLIACWGVRWSDVEAHHNDVAALHRRVVEDATVDMLQKIKNSPADHVRKIKNDNYQTLVETCFRTDKKVMRYDEYVRKNKDSDPA